MRYEKTMWVNGVAALLCALTFGVAGVFCLAAGAYRKVALGDPEAWKLLAFGAIFTFVNFFFGSMMFRAARNSYRTTQLREEHPGKPWMWRDEWQRARVPERAGKVLVIWLFAFVVLGASVELVPEILAAVRNGTWAASFGLVFPVGGLILLYWAVTTTLTRRRFGRSELVLLTHPLPIGGNMQVRLETRAPRDVFANARLAARVESVRRVVRRRDKGTSIVEHAIWDCHIPVRSSAVTAGPHGAMITLSCRIPEGLEPSTVEESDQMVVWRVVVNGSMRGSNYSAAFELPAFPPPPPLQYPPPTR